MVVLYLTFGVSPRADSRLSRQATFVRAIHIGAAQGYGRLVLPRNLGQFEIVGVLGEGGSAVVYAATDGERELALKVLHPEQQVDEHQVARFLDEAERMRRVEHRCLVQILGAGMLPGGRPYIAMPRLEGRPLARRLELGPFSVDQALPLFEGVAGAVDALHQAGLLHRDIKPENVFFCEAKSPNGSGQAAVRLVLLDLGIARDTAANPSTTTRAGLMRGTPAYMAPERLFGQPATVRSDVYELALLLYLMLTARLPWEEGDPSARLSPTLRQEDRQRLPEQLAITLLEALHADVNRRCQSVAELLTRLRAASRSVSTNSANQQLSGPTLESNYARSASVPPFDSRSGERRSILAQPTSTFGSETGAQRRVLPWVAVAALVGFASAAAVYQLPHFRSAPQTAGEALVEPTDRTPFDEAPTAMPSVVVAPTPTSSVLSLSASASASTAPSLSSATSSPVAVGTIKEGVLPASVIEGRVRARMAGMQACLHGEAEQPNFQGGRVTLNFWIGLDGSVTSAKGHGELLSPVIVQCVIAQLRTVKFPPPTGGPVNVIFPIRFTPPTPQR